MTREELEETAQALAAARAHAIGLLGHWADRAVGSPTQGAAGAAVEWGTALARIVGAELEVHRDLRRLEPQERRAAAGQRVADATLLSVDGLLRRVRGVR